MSRKANPKGTEESEAFERYYGLVDDVPGLNTDMVGWGVFDARQNKFIEFPLQPTVAIQRAKELNDAKADVCWVCGAFDFVVTRISSGGLSVILQQIRKFQSRLDIEYCGRCGTVRATVGSR